MKTLTHNRSRYRCPEPEAVPISLPFSDEIQQLLDEMIVVMRQGKRVSDSCVPQVGISQRICVVEIDGAISKISQSGNHEPLAGENLFWKVVLSLPGQFFPIERHEEITVKYWNEKGLPKRIRANGLPRDSAAA